MMMIIIRPYLIHVVNGLVYSHVCAILVFVYVTSILVVFVLVTWSTLGIGGCFYSWLFRVQLRNSIRRPCRGFLQVEWLIIDILFSGSVGYLAVAAQSAAPGLFVNAQVWVCQVCRVIAIFERCSPAEILE